ncbi:MAG: threonine/serine exporter family protein [Bacteroidota bacterium]|nr:threonine/serine exporter family protein [Bacteroidota bacterium]MDP4226983.1 threonine/serine exporter family protein [Bacteroidota bacterium]
MDPQKAKEVKELGSTLLDIGTLLMSSGATTERIRNTVNRISESLGYHTDLFITHRALMLNISDEENDHFFNSLKRTSPHGANFKLVSGISRMSWRVVEEKWSVDQINKELDRLVAIPPYPRWILLLIISMAGGSFCRIAGGEGIEIVVAMVATFAGLFVRQEVSKLKFNPYLCIYIAALTASLISGLAVKLGIGNNPENAFSTSVLFLIPGIPLINSFSDIIDGNVMNGIIRGIHGLIITFAIAMGLLTAMFLYHITFHI